MRRKGVNQGVPLFHVLGTGHNEFHRPCPRLPAHVFNERDVPSRVFENSLTAAQFPVTVLVKKGHAPETALVVSVENAHIRSPSWCGRCQP